MPNDIDSQIKEALSESIQDLPPYHKISCNDPDGEHTCTYLQYGELSAQYYVFFVPGLTGDATNAKYIGEYLSTHHNYCVFAIDLPGRGNSDRFTNHDHYNYVQYASDVHTWIKSCLSTNKDKHVLYIGVSLGGLIAQVMASLYPSAPIDAYCFIDIGAHVGADEIDRIHSYLQSDEFFPSRAEAARYFALVYSSHFGPFVDDQFFIDRSLYALRPIPKRHQPPQAEGTSTGSAGDDHTPSLIEFTLKLDRAGVVSGLLNTQQSPLQDDEHDGKVYSFWTHFQQLKHPLLIYHGETSHLLTQGLINRMKSELESRQVPCESKTWEATGHVPPLYVEEEFIPIHEFFQKQITHKKQA